MSGQTQRRRNAELDLAKIEEGAGRIGVKFYALLHDFSKPLKPDGSHETIKVLQGMVPRNVAREWVEAGWSTWDTEDENEITQEMNF